MADAEVSPSFSHTQLFIWQLPTGESKYSVHYVILLTDACTLLITNNPSSFQANDIYTNCNKEPTVRLLGNSLIEYVILAQN